jgi:hypothetical protein
LQINQKEKYQFNKIFSIINNKYIAEPWNYNKYSSLKLSTINSYFNEFNMTAISNNYFIIYLIPTFDKTSINIELFKLFQKLKKNEYIDNNISIKISIITESNYINLQNISQESQIKTQVLSIENSGMHDIYGYMYEFIKTNRLNKKNIFRIYNLDYSYPQAVELMSCIYKYYAKKKRKKTGIYKKMVRQGVQGKAKKKKEERNVSANNVNNNRKLNINNNVNKKPVNNNQKKKTMINISSSRENNLKKKNNNENNKLNKSFIEEKKNLKKSESEQQSPIKQKSKNVQFELNTSKNIKSITPKRKSFHKLKVINIIFNDLKTIKPEHTLVVHDITASFVSNNEFKKVAIAGGLRGGD